MNTAQRLEATSRPGAIHVSEATQRLLPRENWLPTGGVEVSIWHHRGTKQRVCGRCWSAT